LPATLDLKFSLGNVVDDAIAGDLLARIGLGDMTRKAADDDAELDLVIGLLEFFGMMTSSFGPQIEDVAFMKNIGSEGMAAPASCACNR
jgi:hypothetical protein